MSTIRMTVITGKNGELIAAHQGEAISVDTSKVANLSEFRAGLMAGPGQQIKVIDVSEEVLRLESPVEFERHVKAALGRAG